MLSIPELRPEPHAHATELLQYWGTLLDGRTPPPKSKFDPGQVRRILPHLLIYQRITRQDFQIRLMGTAVVGRVGFEATGRNVLEVISAASRDATASALNKVLDQPCGHYAIVEDLLKSGRKVEVEVIRFPLLDTDGTAQFIVSSTQELKQLTRIEVPSKPLAIARLIHGSFFDWEQTN